MKPTRFHDLTVTGRTQEGCDGACLTLAVPDHLRDTFAFVPGQYVTVRAVVGDEDVRRPYSLCSVPGAGAIQIGVKRVSGGRMSNYLNDLAEGQTLQVMAPEGRFQAQGGADILLIAAGSGITPILSIAETALERDPEAQVTLVYGNRETASIMFLDRLSDLKDRHLGRLRAIHILSRERQDADLFNGRIDGGKLAALEEAGLIEPGRASGIYLCGPGGLIETAEDHFQACGVDPKSLHSERFLAADGSAPAPSAAAQQAADAGVEVETILDGLRKTFPVTEPGQMVLDAAQAAGVDLPYACANGMCCTCRCRIAEGSAEMAVNYSLEEWEIEQGFTLACQARPTSERLVLDFDAV